MKTEIKSLSRREFVRVAGAGVAGGLLGFPAIRCSGAPESGVPKSRLDRLGKGTNICEWFRGDRGQDAEQLENYITETEAHWMRKMGLTHVRLCLQPKAVMDQTTGAILEDHAKYVVAAIERLHRAGLLVLVDLHNEDRSCEMNPAWQEAFVKFWGDFAARLKRFDPELTILEIVNEPVFNGHESEWNPHNARLAAAIRKSAPSHTIMTSGVNWGGIEGLYKLTVLNDPNIVYSFHCYDPFPFTHQGATWAGPEVVPLRNVPYPSSPEAVAPLLPGLAGHPESVKLVESYGKAAWNKAKLAARFKEGIEWGAKNKAPLYCGEFGVLPTYAKPEHRANWFRDFGQVLAQHKIGWAVWGWDQSFGFNRTYADGKPVVDQMVTEALGLTVV